MSENIGASAPSESTSESSTPEQTAPQTQTPEQKAAISAADAEKLARKFKVKVDGAESEVDEDELVRSYQLRKVSDKRLQEATQARKQAEEFVNLLKHDPIKLLSDPRIGHDVKKLAEEYLMKELENEMLTPEQKELREAKAKLKTYEEMKAEQEKAAVAAQEKQLMDHYTQKYQQDIISALDSSGLPRTEATVNRMIHYMAQSLEKQYGFEATDVVDLVKMDYIRDTKALYAGVPDEVLLDILGDDIIKKVVKADLNKMKRNPMATQTKTQHVGNIQPKKSEKISIDQWKEKMQRIKEGKE